MISNFPPHIFFDGTILDDKFLEKKLHNVKFDRIKIDVGGDTPSPGCESPELFEPFYRPG